jgi:hypothetical protein
MKSAFQIIFFDAFKCDDVNLPTIKRKYGGYLKNNHRGRIKPTRGRKIHNIFRRDYWTFE